MLSKLLGLALAITCVAASATLTLDNAKRMVGYRLRTIFYNGDNASIDSWEKFVRETKQLRERVPPNERETFDAHYLMIIDNPLVCMKIREVLIKESRVWKLKRWLKTTPNQNIKAEIQSRILALLCSCATAAQTASEQLGKSKKWVRTYWKRFEREPTLQNWKELVSSSKTDKFGTSKPFADLTRVYNELIRKEGQHGSKAQVENEKKSSLVELHRQLAKCIRDNETPLKKAITQSCGSDSGFRKFSQRRLDLYTRWLALLPVTKNRFLSIIRTNMLRRIAEIKAHGDIEDHIQKKAKNNFPENEKRHQHARNRRRIDVHTLRHLQSHNIEGLENHELKASWAKELQAKVKHLSEASDPTKLRWMQ